MKNYRNAFIVTLIASLVLACGIVYVGWFYVLRHPASVVTVAAAAASGSAVADRTTGESPSGTTASTAPAKAAPTRLSPIQLSPERMQSIGVRSGVVQMQPVVDDIRTVGNVAIDERLLSYVQLRFSGWIQKVFVNSTYQYVRRGQPLFTIYSPSLVTTEQEYLIAKQNHALLGSSTIPGVATGSASLLSAATARLEQWQVPQREIQRLEKTGRASRELTIDSPAAGYVTEYNALPQLYAQPQTRLYTLANLSSVWVFAAFYQDQIEGIAPGDPATVTVETYPGKSFHGRVDFVYPEVDPTTRTARVRLIFSNPGVTLKPGMFVNVDVKRPMGHKLVIPATGVFQTGTHSVVFVDRGGGYLQPRDVVVGSQVGGNYIVLKGLKPGERIVTSANFLIDSESQLQAALGGFMPPPPAAAGTGGSATQYTLEFSSLPARPQKGSNSIQAKLTDAKGHPVDGAQVQVRFVLPGMPSMGMPAQKVQVKLTGKGRGTYEGRANLPAAGNWQASIVAQRAGQVIASRQVSPGDGGGN